MASDEIKKLAACGRSYFFTIGVVKPHAKGLQEGCELCAKHLKVAEAAEALGYERAKEEAATLLDARYAAYKAREEVQADNSYYISVHSALLATAVEVRSDAAAIRALPERKG